VKADATPLPLSAKQQRMLELLAEGKQNRDIATAMGYQEGTMRVYLHNLYRYIGVGNKTEAVVWWQARTRSNWGAWMPIERELPRTAERDRWFAVKLSADGAARLGRLGNGLPVRALQGVVIRELHQAVGITHWLGPLPE
jgi:DNA-binding CsgD family transcriptional regulator